MEGKQEIPQKDSDIMTVSDLEPVLPRIGNLMCSAQIGGQFPIVSEGSASLWVVNWTWGKNLILTNYHILTPELDSCDVWFDDIGIYRVNIKRIPSWAFNNIVDFAFLRIESIAPGLEGAALPISSLSPTIYPSHCPSKMSLGSPIAVIGFPITAASQVDIPGGEPGRMSNKTVTTGTISSHDTNPTINGYPDVNYFVSAKIDKGNSGGLAFSKYNGEICLLGIPTWVERGYFENMGIIQSIHNIWNPNP